ncbi:histidine phosphatase family protein [Pseudonocardia sp. KRD-184]|uniref:Histidine phosphatase family protein n=1 Tax=Pseudonocardia oceani TaxID=2792013 RepID=A0ABS6U624_9PSEU|nr:histidine phosphatase family protein [Pseudonocardia oceani]MBW0089009.1 histidine phosphatase family protein [Pseudonocardia oceani]MBW0094894.1 histidine phosphatase family protein [Pseudonocardia oceani]MBW0108691.1 histidine phosphatase family protein [Pseudonocardia oceani]MBW0120787.1 histidine phosphatase family protein [Pseudonocardia oceani]MBW0127668.1 histidine phosphatase family protein [Pseudonocardia oceani]
MLILVRHGQTVANARGLLCGHADHPLTELGCRQAQALAAALPRPARILTSPLGRARQTAAVLAGERPVEVDERWIEMDYGRLDGAVPTDVDGGTWSRWHTDPDFAPPGGESLAAVGQRVRAACLDLAADAARGDVVVVSHVSPIKAAVAWALGVGDTAVWRLFLGDAAVCRIDTSAPVPVLGCFSSPS